MKNCEIRIKKKYEKITQQKCRRIPTSIQNQVDKEIEMLLKEVHIEKGDKIKYEVFVQPTVITIRNDESVKIASEPECVISVYS